MFQGFSNATADFFWALALNNNRAWFLEHKEEFEDVLNRPFRALAADTIDLMQARFPDDDFQAHVARIYRDARRTYGKGPYKESLWFTIQPGERHPIGPLFWFDIEGTAWSCGAGFWDCPPALAEVYRKKLDAEPERFLKIVDDLEARCEFKVWGEPYKRPKAERGSRLDPWYNLKRVSVGYEKPFGQALFSADLPKALVETYAALMPLYRFLRECWTEYQHALAAQQALATGANRYVF